MKKVIGILILLFLSINLVFGDDFYQCSISSDNSKKECKTTNIVQKCQIYDHSFNGIGIPTYCSNNCVEKSEINKNCAKVSIEKSTNLEAHKGFTSKFKSFYHGTFNSGIEDEKIAEIIEINSVGKVLNFEGKVFLIKNLKTIKINKNMELFSGDKLNIAENSSIKVYLSNRGALTISGPTTFQVPTEDSTINLDKNKSIDKSGFIANTYYKIKSYFTSEESQELGDGVRG